MNKSKSKNLSIKNFLLISRPYLPSWWIISTAVVLVIIGATLSLIVPLLARNIVNQILNSGLDISNALLLGGIFIIQVVFSGISLYMMIYIGQIIVSGLRKYLWGHVLYLPVSFFDRNASGEIMSRIINDTNVIKNFFTNQLSSFFSGVITIVGSIIILFFLDWQITLFLFIIIPLSYAIVTPLGRKMYEITKGQQSETASLQGNMERVLSDIRLVKSSTTEPIEIEQGDSYIKKLLNYGLRGGKVLAVIDPLITSAMLLVLVITFGYGGIKVSTGEISAGTLVAMVIYMFQLTTPLSQIAQFFTQFQKAMGASERIKNIMDEETEKVSIEDENFLEKNELTFSNVNFSYTNKKEVLKNVSFSAKVGEMTAIVGPTGAGKTTIFSLIERFYTISHGILSYNWKSIYAYNLSDWRKKIAYVSQESPIMSGSIRDNLTYGLSYIADEELIRSAVEKANLTSFIETLTDGYDTEVGEHGIRLSGGQRQRLSIARAIIQDPDILLLDEATSHLDSASEHLVQMALNTLMINRTTIVIAHRLSTVRHADRIVVLEEGCVTGEGTHDELYASHNLYKKFVDQQEFGSRMIT